MKPFNDLYNVMKLMQNIASKIQIWILQPTGPRKAKARKEAQRKLLALLNGVYRLLMWV